MYDIRFAIFDFRCTIVYLDFRQKEAAFILLKTASFFYISKQ